MINTHSLSLSCQISKNSTPRIPVGNDVFPRKGCNNKVLENFKSPNIPPSRAVATPQSHPWNSKYLIEHKRHIFQIQYILAAVVTDYVKPQPRGSELMYAWTEAAAALSVHWVNDVQIRTAILTFSLLDLDAGMGRLCWNAMRSNLLKQY